VAVPLPVLFKLHVVEKVRVLGLFAEFACTSVRKDHDCRRLRKVCPHIYEDISNAGVLMTHLKQLQFHSQDEHEPTRIAGFCSQWEQNLFFSLKKARGSAAFP
jgi:hypothetical protein